MKRRLPGLCLCLVLAALMSPAGAIAAAPPIVGLSIGSGQTPVPGHPCDPTNFYMQCAATAPGQILTPPAGTKPGLALFGIDFAWGGPSGSYAVARGAHFAISYLSGDPSKDWSVSLMRSYLSVHAGVGFVWETAAARTFGGCSAGASDAWRARWLLQNVYHVWPTPVFFATDVDTSGFGLYGTVGAYYRCEGQVMGADSGAYGGKRTIEIAAANGNHFLWQTLAWSYGSWDSRSCLRQTNIERPWYGYSMDFDVALCSNWGQVGGGPKPGPSKQQIAQWRGGRDSSLRAFHARKCSSRTLGHKDCFTFGQRVINFQGKLNTVQARPRCFGRHAHNHAAVCQIVQPYMKRWVSGRDATRAAVATRHCSANARRGDCGVLNRRLAWFQGQINRNFY